MMNGWDRITFNPQAKIRSANDWIPDLGHPNKAQVANLNTDLVLPGTVSGGALVCRDRLAGVGMRFNGRNGCRVQTGNTPTGKPPCSISAWFTSLGSALGEYLVTRAGIQVMFRVVSNALSGGDGAHLAQYNYNPRDGLKHHAVTTITASGLTYLYLDGLQVATRDDGIGSHTASTVIIVGSRTANDYAWNGDIYAPAIHDGIILTPAEIAAEWNRYSQAKSFILTPDVPTGTHSTAGAWIGPVQLLSGTVVVENTGALAPAPQVQVRSTVAATMSLYADGHYNGCTGPSVEGYGTFEAWITNAVSNATVIDLNNGAAGSVRVTIAANGSIDITRIGTGSLFASVAGLFSTTRRKLRIQTSKDLATGYQCTAWVDDVLVAAASGANPTARVAVTLTQPSINITLGAGNSLGYDGMSWSPGWRV